MAKARPQTREIRGKLYELVVLKVLERDAQGRPSKFECGYDDSVFKIDGGEDFITAYIHQDSLAPRTTH